MYSLVFGLGSLVLGLGANECCQIATDGGGLPMNCRRPALKRQNRGAVATGSILGRTQRSVYQINEHPPGIQGW